MKAPEPLYTPANKGSLETVGSVSVGIVMVTETKGLGSVVEVPDGGVKESEKIRSKRYFVVVGMKSWDE